MTDVLKPETAEQALDVLRWAAAEEVPLEVLGAGSKRAFGRPFQATHGLDTSALAGITLHEPEELVMSAGPGTRLAEIEATLAEANQQLAFEPADLGPLLGGTGGAGTIGGVFSCNLTGPRRIKAGAARDHLLGLQAVSGRGEAFKSGGRVVKNVTGYDVAKLMTGAFGTLGVFTQLTFKVLPAPETVRTLLLFGLDDATAVKALTAALQSPFEVSGAAHLPAPVAARTVAAADTEDAMAVTALRLEGFARSVAARVEGLATALASFGATQSLDADATETFWKQVRDVAPFVGAAGEERDVWKLSVPPMAGPAVASRLSASAGAEHYFDWGGGLIWAALPASADGGAAKTRAAIAECGGHATLTRAPEAVRAAVDVFQPQPAALAALTARVKDSFDPKRILNPGRMYAGV
ncbi:MAG: glycolate oxidase subunit GlcE [Inquilinus sp.]|nr:glycolate oxidase subunit GlcE [Inquilinus sp.]